MFSGRRDSVFPKAIQMILDPVRKVRRGVWHVILPTLMAWPGINYTCGRIHEAEGAGDMRHHLSPLSPTSLSHLIASSGKRRERPRERSWIRLRMSCNHHSSRTDYAVEVRHTMDPIPKQFPFIDLSIYGAWLSGGSLRFHMVLTSEIEFTFGKVMVMDKLTNTWW